MRSRIFLYSPSRLYGKLLKGHIGKILKTLDPFGEQKLSVNNGTPVVVIQRGSARGDVRKSADGEAHLPLLSSARFFRAPR